MNVSDSYNDAEVKALSQCTVHHSVNVETINTVSNQAASDQIERLKSLMNSRFRVIFMGLVRDT